MSLVKKLPIDSTSMLNQFLLVNQWLPKTAIEIWDQDIWTFASFGKLNGNFSFPQPREEAIMNLFDEQLI